MNCLVILTLIMVELRRNLVVAIGHQELWTRASSNLLCALLVCAISLNVLNIGKPKV